jgi:hypothetical protein
MMTQTTHITRLFDTDEDGGTEVELLIDLAPGEPDVGVHGPYIDNWAVIAVNGNSTDEQFCLLTEQRILDEYGDEEFVELLYDEGVGS